MASDLEEVLGLVWLHMHDKKHENNKIEQVNGRSLGRILHLYLDSKANLSGSGRKKKSWKAELDQIEFRYHTT